MQQATTSNVQMMKDAYAAMERGDLDTALKDFSPDIVWYLAEGHASAVNNPHVGIEVVRRDMIESLKDDWAELNIQIDEWLDAGHKVIGFGRYKGSYIPTGKQIDAQMAHVWTIENGKIVHFQQYLDTKQIHEATTTTD